MGVTGREGTMAFGVTVANSWGVATSVTRRIYFESDAGMTSKPTYVDDASFGQTFLGPADVGDFEPIDVTLTGQAYYDHWDHWLEALAMGSPAVTAYGSQGAAGSMVSYQHILQLAPNTDGRAATIASDKKLFVEEITSGKIYGFSLGVGNGGVITKSFKVMGSKSTGSSTINTRSAVVASPTAPALSNRIFRNQGVVRMNLQSGAALAAADALADVTDFTFDFNRPVESAMVFNQAYTAEPLNNGFPTVEMTLNFRQATTVSTNSFYAICQAGTALKGDVTFTGAYINSSDARKYILEFPHLEAQEFTFGVNGAEQAKPTIRLVAKMATTSPTSMAIVNPFKLTRYSICSTAAF